MNASSQRRAARRRAIDPHARTVIVTDANHPISMPFVRSLGRDGWRVVTAGPDRGSLAFRSRYSHRSLVYPSPGQRPDLFAEAIGAAARACDAALVVPLSEATMVALSEHRDRLPESSRATLPEPDALAVVLNKERTMELARRHGVPVPDSYLARSPAEAADRAAGMRAPFVLKPVTPRMRITGRSRLGTLHARDAPHVAVQAARLFPDSDGVLVQEYIRGEGVGVDMLLRDGTPLLAFQHRRIREMPVFGGPSALREAVPLDPDLYADAVTLLSELRWTGLAMVEFKVGPDDRRLMEINGRAWGSIPLAVAAGVDFPRAVARLYLQPGESPAETVIDPAAPPGYDVGVRSRNLLLDLLWAGSVLTRRPRHDVHPWPPRREGLRALLQLLDPSIGFDVLSRDDPRPGVAELRHIVRYLTGRFIRR